MGSRPTPSSCPRCCTSAPGSAATCGRQPRCAREDHSRDDARQQHHIINRYYEGVPGRRAPAVAKCEPRQHHTGADEARIRQYMTLLPGAHEMITPARHDRMHPIVFLAQITERLRCTYDGRANGYEKSPSVQGRRTSRSRESASQQGHERRPLLRPATAASDRHIQVHLVTLDVRQHASVLHQVIAHGMTIKNGSSAPARRRRELLADALEHDRGPKIELDALERDRGIRRPLHQGVIATVAGGGQPVVSSTKGADDILAALLLARWASVYDKRTGEVALDIAPQFESVNALERCGQTMQELLADPLYRRHLEAHGRQQCVMLGYSDSNKEVGTCASRMAITRRSGPWHRCWRPPATALLCSTHAAEAWRA